MLAHFLMGHSPETVYGVLPEEVVGWSIKTSSRCAKASQSFSACWGESMAGPAIPVGINEYIGRRRIVALGNSDGDLGMLHGRPWPVASALA
jgi:hypothetical protein